MAFGGRPLRSLVLWAAMLHRRVWLVGALLLCCGCSASTSQGSDASLPEQDHRRPLLPPLLDWGLRLDTAIDAPPDPIVPLLQKAMVWQVTNPEPAWDKFPRGWARAVLYAGISTVYRVVGDDTFLSAALAWAEGNEWKIGDNTDHADDQCSGQAYLELYLVERGPERIRSIQQAVDEIIATPQPGEEIWYWCDALFMAPPILARLAAATSDSRYLELLNELYWPAKEALFDEEAGLFYRTPIYKELTTKNGQPIFWSRGNGWVMAGVVRILEYLPPDDPRREDYVALLQTMAQSVAPLQGDDGMWRSSLYDPEEFPMPESSGTALFCYALAWGINNQILDEQRYGPLVNKAWQALVAALSDDGRLGWAQNQGSRPAACEEDEAHEYATGAFLMAGAEVWRRSHGKAESSQ